MWWICFHISIYFWQSSTGEPFLKKRWHTGSFIQKENFLCERLPFESRGKLFTNYAGSVSRDQVLCKRSALRRDEVFCSKIYLFRRFKHLLIPEIWRFSSKIYFFRFFSYSDLWRNFSNVATASNLNNIGLWPSHFIQQAGLFYICLILGSFAPFTMSESTFYDLPVFFFNVTFVCYEYRSGKATIFFIFSCLKFILYLYLLETYFISLLAWNICHIFTFFKHIFNIFTWVKHILNIFTWVKHILNGVRTPAFNRDQHGCTARLLFFGGNSIFPKFFVKRYCQ